METLPGLRVLAIQGRDGRFVPIEGLEGRESKLEPQVKVLRLERVGRVPGRPQEEPQGTVVFDSTIDAA